ncbi:helix-turn-helix domain-containing protein [Solwaraspora sp. WMMD1047]|uniref:helix-turn-helix domain-containing protein n=1 Tax=Solwaraspora sp. WMMD1047 TaxID=3016102 RepID=UPI0024171919|nr:helix-turn-helix domain-containing protein [Solwaraspora sp. WMMD1047]MDG4834666.1 helix-turn-helix domain-containing protein [Solwaraspora sp. WMMD1047]
MNRDHGGDQVPAGFSDLLRTRRRQAGLTQAELAERAGVGVRTVRDLERGRSQRPQRTTVELLAAALGMAGSDRSEFAAAARRSGPGSIDGYPRDGGATGLRSTAPAGNPAPPPGGSDGPGEGGPGEGGPDGGGSGGGGSGGGGSGGGGEVAGGPAGGRPGGGRRVGGGSAGIGPGARAGLGLPVPGELIGRDGDVAEVAAALTGTGVPGPGFTEDPAPAVVSLVGLAGVGKTCLALAVAHRLAEWHPGGIAGIVITEESTESDVLSATATVFGVGRAADLPERLADAPCLLLVDAVERSPGAVAEALQWLVRTAPGLRVLTTGRHPVGLPGELVWPVAPLEVPPADIATELSEVARYPAAELLLARLRQVRREPPQPDEVPALIGLVRRLGGLPLAIELAAARGNILDLNEILGRYGNRVLDLARPPVARAAVALTLRDAVAASYRLLAPDERAAVRRLAVFRNRWSLELAEEMLAEEDGAPPAVGRAATSDPLTADPPAPGRGGLPGPPALGRDVDPVPLLDRLLALGLLSARGATQFRFRLVDVVRDFAAERAAANGELAAIRRRHAVVMARLAARSATELAGANLVGAVGRLDEVTSDLWAALSHSASDDPHTALALAASLTRWWRFRGRDVAGRRWLRRLLADPRTDDADPAVRAWAQVGVAQLAQEHGAGPEELPAVRSALAEFQRLADVPGELAARSVLCGLWVALGGYEQARQHGLAVLELASRHGRVRDMAVAQNNLTWHEIRVGDLAAARRRLAAVDRLAAQCGDERLRVLARANLAEVARLDGRYPDAVNQGRRVLAALAELGDPGHRRRMLGTIGLALAQDGQLDAAVAVLVDLRAGGKDGAEPRDDGMAYRDDGICALIEATLALRRGDREWAAEWFGAAAQAYQGCRDLRDVVESLVGLVASSDDPEARDDALARLEQVCAEGAITLLPLERALIGSVGVRIPGPRRAELADRQD